MNEEIICSYVKCREKATGAYITSGMFFSMSGSLEKREYISLCCERHSIYQDSTSLPMTMEEYKIWKIHND